MIRECHYELIKDMTVHGKEKATKSIDLNQTRKSTNREEYFSGGVFFCVLLLEIIYLWRECSSIRDGMDNHAAVHITKKFGI